MGQPCYECGDHEKSGQHDEFCSEECRSILLGNAPVLVKLTDDNDMYDEILSDFHDAWEYIDVRLSRVVSVWKIFCAPANREDFMAYRSTIHKKRDVQCNQRLLYHGTTRACTLGDEDDKFYDLCAYSNCSVCEIIRSSFKCSNKGRFGTGIYTSPISSKANCYTREHSSQFRSMLLNKVVLGRSLDVYDDCPDLTEPLPGYDSVRGISEPGGSLDHEEIIVYNPDAIRPDYLIIYEVAVDSDEE